MAEGCYIDMMLWPNSVGEVDGALTYDLGWRDIDQALVSDVIITIIVVNDHAELVRLLWQFRKEMSSPGERNTPELDSASAWELNNDTHQEESDSVLSKGGLLNL